MRVHVTLSCSLSPTPGIDWSVTVAFVGNAKTYRVWSQTDQDPRRVLLKHSCGPLDWRRMIADIRELDDVGLAVGAGANVLVFSRLEFAGSDKPLAPSHGRRKALTAVNPPLNR